jgi:hypothetical protein
MKPLTFLFMSASVAFASVQSFAQDSNSWGKTFACSVDWFVACAMISVAPAVDSEKPNGRAVTTTITSPSFLRQSVHIPEPVRNVLENPSPETARAYVTWSRQANEKLAKATEYIAQATRELNAEAVSQMSIEKSSAIAAPGLGPVGLYYFFSPNDQSASKDVAVLNKIFQEGRLGVVGIPVSGKDEDVGNYVNEAKPLFPIRRSDAEVKLIKPAETPNLYLVLPAEKKIFRLGPVISEMAIAKAITNVFAESMKINADFNMTTPDGS